MVDKLPEHVIIFLIESICPHLEVVGLALDKHENLLDILKVAADVLDFLV